VDVRIEIARERRGPPWGWNIAWSPDGSTFAANAYGEDIVVVRNESKRNITGNFYGFGWIGPDTLVGYSAPTENGLATLIRFDAVTGDSLEAFKVPAFVRDVAISPDGSFVAYAQWRDGYDVETSLHEWGSSGNFSFIAAPLSNPHQPYRFTADGDGFLVVTNLCEESQGLAIARRDGSVEPLAEGFVMVAKFSPDGQTIAFTTGLELYVSPAAGGSPPTLIASDVHGPAGLEWSPDGSTIAVAPYFGGFGACE
jgi:dipeptidyl aminopeptidase/acylaminoacyl peptidase